MAIPKFEDDLRIISKIGANPGTDNGYTTQEFKEAFDKAPLLIQKFINEVLIPAANASSSPEEGLSMKGPINMNGQSLSGLNSPTKDNEAATKGYVDTAISDAIDNVKSVAKTATLAAGSWSNNAQTVAVEGVTEDNNIIVTGNPDCIEAWTNAGVYCTAQAANALTFTCTDVPTEELTANILILG